MQDNLFGDLPSPSPAAAAPTEPTAAPVRRKRATEVGPAAPDAALQAVAAALPSRVRLGTSSWSYPGWAHLVWDGGGYSDTLLSKEGLSAYGQHPLLRTVSVDRSFYRPLTQDQYARCAAQVPDDFRFVVKAPSHVTDAMVRGEAGRGLQPNPAFLDPVLATQDFVAPALAGLGHKVGALVFQLSPMPRHLLRNLPLVLQRVRTLLLAQPPLAPTAPDGVLALEVRDPEWLEPALLPELAAVLREAGATWCLCLHAKMPRLAEQLPLLRLLWPGPMVCRWNLNPLHGAYGYEEAQREYSPYDRIHDVDEETRALLVKTIAGISGAGQNVFVTISNKAEGCAPLSARALAEGLAAWQRLPSAQP
ncbi:DUF72 domain-containing protein [Hydrogenophaga sp.]|uniref:DUF72 domain-containing protein n=1 Tax=Hydrogenophaga sp. TaxID=1904254 RepID=UPI00271FD13D|nr:DUF72 domain-containing protein [Hydrogenophaga sp.]MDO9438809.1 DUF72 domain-containing protein [Hydrogenophaga sp.]